MLFGTLLFYKNKQGATYRPTAAFLEEAHEGEKGILNCPTTWANIVLSEKSFDPTEACLEGSGHSSKRAVTAMEFIKPLADKGAFFPCSGLAGSKGAQLSRPGS